MGIVVEPQNELSKLQTEIHKTAREHGFWDASTNIGEKLALIHSEVSEALEEYRKAPLVVPMEDGQQIGPPEHEFMFYFGKDNKPEGIAIELADAVIRILDLAEYLDIDLQFAMATKMAYNQTREHMHGKSI